MQSVENKDEKYMRNEIPAGSSKNIIVAILQGYMWKKDFIVTVLAKIIPVGL